MELESHEDQISEDVVFDVADYIDDTAFENEKCGICMDFIVDRGVLDCCDHWFCFACIDNWATITNLCPLCKCEFQLITCIPVYDTIGNNKLGEDSLSRDDDWCIQGKNNTLSFPSYYIDENAVICLDGDGCKLRNGLVTTEEGLTLDTSIACDSCDLWYHAFCVGFDPESTSENSWWCPRCKIDEVPLESDGVLVQRASEQCVHESTDFACPMEDAFSGKVLVSVADAGETAVVVSMVEGKKWTGASENFLLKKLDVDSDEKPVISSDEKPVISSDADTDTVKTEMQLNDSGSCSIYGKDRTVGALAPDNQDNPEKSFNISLQRTTLQSNINEQETLLSLSLSCDASLLSPGDSSSFSDLKTDIVNKGLCKPSGPNGCKVSSPLLDTFCTTSRPSESECNIDLHLGLHVGASLLVDKRASDATENQLAEPEQKPSVESSLSVDKMAGDDTIENVVGVTRQKNLEVSGVKRKHTDRSRDDAHMTDHTEGKETSAKIQKGNEIPAKKAKSDEKSKTAPLKCRVDASISNGSGDISRPVALSKDNKLKHIRRKEATATDIMSIVQGNDRRSSKAPAGPNSEEKSTKEGDNIVGLRIKKIMRRVADNESSTLLQKLRQEIREAVRNKSSKDSARSDILDTELLTAFRAAVVRPQNELTPKIDPSVIRAKKVMLQKGKIREKLTKKIYGTASGRRRHAWDRDWEVEFWKHRCTSTQPEKVQTLRSVLDLLKRSSQSCSESSEMEQGPEGEVKNSILSRLYLADASVFPRKEDIKPLSALRGSAMTGNHEREENNLSNESQKVNKSVHENHMVETFAPMSRISQDRVPSCDNTGKRSIVPSFKGEASCRKAHPNGTTGGPASISMSSGSKGHAQTTKENPGKSDDVKSDKRRWALQVLARKTASVNRDAAQGKEEDNSALRGTYPLLAQLPADMRPVLARIRHSKVPTSVRQAQLNRLTEHYLRKTNLPVMYRTAGTELAVADAVNVEKEICDKSNSKLVYVNLCSQVLSQHTNNSKLKTAETTAFCPEAGPAESMEHVAIEPFSDPTAGTCENVEEALKMAGFLSDSPPNSPYRAVEDLNDKDAPSEKVAEEGIENVFDIDSHPDLDIYGDFEYDLGDEDFVGPSSISSALRVSKLQSEDGDLKMKVVLSTINYEKTCLALDSNDNAVKHVQNEVVTSHHEKLGIVEAPMDSLSVLKCHTDRGIGSSILELKIDAPCPSPKTHDGERSEEPSLAECEELYGPDKEPLVDEICDEAMSEPNKCMEKEAIAENTVPVGKENYRSNKEAAADTQFVSESCMENSIAGGGIPFNHDSSRGENSPNHSENAPRKEAKSNSINQSDLCHSVTKKVEAYVKEHIRPLCKSGVITAEQYRWAVGKTTEKVMKYHSKAKNANFLIKEGDKVKKLAEQYVEAAHQK
ncbi:uncharacterized protein At4g10930 isoform X2 [Magnolia sinica]|nr:uncharacterized protein At4g10930 isoform X2 [Magnolia sinica]